MIEADRNKWQIFVDAVINAFKMGYTFKTLIHALKQPGITGRNLPPPPRPGPGDSVPLGSQLHVPQALEDSVPEFSHQAMHEYLVRFVVADDQVRLDIVS